MKPSAAFAALLVFLAVLCTDVSAAGDFDGHVFWVTSGTSKTVEWVAPQGSDGFEIYVLMMETGARLLAGKIVNEPRLSVTWRTPGHYIVYVRAYITSGGIRFFGEWKNSLDPSIGLVDGQPKGWAVYVPFLY